MARKLAKTLAPHASALREIARAELARRGSPLKAALEELASRLGITGSDEQLAECAAHLICDALRSSRAAQRASERFDTATGVAWLSSRAPEVAHVLASGNEAMDAAVHRLCVALSERAPGSVGLAAGDPYEWICVALDKHERSRRGVFFTPPALVGYVVRSVEELLADRFEMSWASKGLVVLDPAAGTGAFVREVVGRAEPGGANVVACELSAAALAVGKTRAAIDHGPEALTWKHCNALEATAYLRELAAGASTLAVMGNPPYSGHSQTASDAIAGLLRGRDPESGVRTSSYFEVEGAALGERNPKWLNDDYVKFLRLAQWCVETAGRGLVAFVCNHGYLDHPTFRGVRSGLMETFDEMWLLDLHGNSKKLERAPDGSIDENVFDIQTGVSIGLFVRTGSPVRARTVVHHADLFGTCADKLAWLDRNSQATTSWTTVTPNAPSYLYIPRDDKLRVEYERGWRISDAMPVASVGIVTGRDTLVVDTRREHLEARMRSLLGSELPSREQLGIRANDGLDLESVRAALRREPSLEPFFQECLYRPFDKRIVFNHPAVIERSREQVMRHMRDENNLAIIARRQMPPSRPCTYFGVSGCAIVDGVIRSDNHGSESIFPLYVGGTDSNFAPAFAAECRSMWQVDPSTRTGGADVFAYLYALMNAPSYRVRYAEQLRGDFPRVPLCRGIALYEALRDAGHRLIALHLVRGIESVSIGLPHRGSNHVEHVRRDGERVWINGAQFFDGVSERDWEHYWGGYTPASKWLKDREGETLSVDDVAHYGRIVTALRCSRDRTDAIDGAIEANGGWPIG